MHLTLHLHFQRHEHFFRDIALMIHPGNETYKTIDTLAVDVLDVKFYGKSAHACIFRGMSTFSVKFNI
jgi:hypothetical protein